MPERRFTLGIDATNISSGGGLNNFIEILKEADPPSLGIGKVFIWCNRYVIDLLPDRKWMEKIHVPKMDRSIIWRLYWQHISLPRVLRAKGCDALYSPGGLSPILGLSIPTIVMSGNMLPFDLKELYRYPFLSYGRLRLKLLRRGLWRSFGRAAMVIFLAPYAKNHITSLLKGSVKRSVVISSGIEPRFFCRPRLPIQPHEISRSRPFRFLYVSHIDLYKHQWNVAEAAKKLVDEGLFVTVDFLVSTYSYPAALKKFEKKRMELDPKGEFLHCNFHKPFERLPKIYQEADCFLFASSCESLPSVILEAMASGLPIACSNRVTMPELVGDAGLFFNPEVPSEIAMRMRELILDADLRAKLADCAYQRAQNYSWKRCAEQTFSTIKEVLISDLPRTPTFRL